MVLLSQLGYWFGIKATNDRKQFAEDVPLFGPDLEQINNKN